MHLEHNETNPEQLMKVLEAVDSVSEQVNQKEGECLNRIYIRFCLLKGLLINYDYVKRKNYAGRDNYWEYWYKHGTKEQHFLMSRELRIEDNQPRLDIIFSKELVKNNEL